MLQRGLEHLRAGEFENAAACFVKAHRLNPDRPEVCYALGREFLRRGEVARAEPLLRAAWDKDRTLVSAGGTLARCLGLYQRRFDQAHVVLDQAGVEHGLLPVLEVIRSELYVEQEQYDRAKHHAETALTELARESSVGDGRSDRIDATWAAANSVLARVCNHEGISLTESGAREQALFLFKRAADLDPHWSGPHINMGAVFAQLGKSDSALRAYERGVAIEPNSGVAHFNYGLLLRTIGELDRARVALSRAVDCDPEAAEVIPALAIAHLEADNPDQAIDLLAWAIEAEPDDPELWVQLGIAFATAGELDEAESSWRHSLELDPDNIEAAMHLGDLLARRSRACEDPSAPGDPPIDHE
ncbi:MAG: tetratricopeptide repeat protein [Myxococcota bacterium]